MVVIIFAAPNEQYLRHLDGKARHGFQELLGQNTFLQKRNQFYVASLRTVRCPVGNQTCLQQPLKASVLPTLVVLKHPNWAADLLFDSSTVHQRPATAFAAPHATSWRHRIRTRFHKTDRCQKRHIPSHRKVVPRAQRSHIQDSKTFYYCALKYSRFVG